MHDWCSGKLIYVAMGTHQHLCFACVILDIVSCFVGRGLLLCDVQTFASIRSIPFTRVKAKYRFQDKELLLFCNLCHNVCLCFTRYSNTVTNVCCTAVPGQRMSRPVCKK